MRQETKKYLLCIAILALSTACRKEVDVKVPELKPQLVIHSHSDAGKLIIANIGKSIAVTKYNYSWADSFSIRHARVLLYVNGVIKDTLQYIPDSSSYNFGASYYSQIVISPGNNYKIVASAPGFTDAEGEMAVPATVTINSVKRNEYARIDINQGIQDELRIKFDDASTPGDYYMLDILQNEENYSYGACVYTADPSIETASGQGGDDLGLAPEENCIPTTGMLMRDDLFNGTTKELRLYISHDFLEPWEDNFGVMHYPMVKLSHISEAYFRYLKTSEAARMTDGNPFAEPVNIYTNIKNGYGIFSIANVATKEVR
jgi:hypothetical protein